MRCNRYFDLFLIKTVLLCAAITCYSFPSVINASRLDTDARAFNISFGSIAAYSCYSGQKFTDGSRNKFVKCIGQDSWNDTDLTCDCKFAFNKNYEKDSVDANRQNDKG